MRRLARFVCLGLGAAAGGLALASCTPTGNYRLSWDFFPRADGTGEPQGAGNSCGLHGVDAIFIQGTSGGNGATRIALCTPGAALGDVGLGDWTFSLQAMDVRGTLIGDPVSTMTLTVSEGATQEFPTVTLTPRPECSDGIDNDGDGLVDRDDPGCANFDPSNPHDTTLESSAGPGSGFDGGAPDAGGAEGGTEAGTADGGTDSAAPDGSPSDAADLDAAAADAAAADAGGGDASPADAGVPDDAAAGG